MENIFFKNVHNAWFLYNFFTAFTEKLFISLNNYLYSYYLYLSYYFIICLLFRVMCKPNTNQTRTKHEPNTNQTRNICVRSAASRVKKNEVFQKSFCPLFSKSGKRKRIPLLMLLPSFAYFSTWKSRSPKAVAYVRTNSVYVRTNSVSVRTNSVSVVFSKESQGMECLTCLFVLSACDNCSIPIY